MASLSAEALPQTLARLIGQHPAALRTVCWTEKPHKPGAPAHLEIETKHGFVILIDHRSGGVYANPPVPPDADVHLSRWQQDLTERVPCAFAGRPRFATIASVREPTGQPSGDNPERIVWYFSFDTGAAFTLTSGSLTSSSGIQIVSS